ncbi:MAG: YndJ family transporter [Saprospiraceae bacterium]|nr:YndJ family transporter [Saprospiraceae bacterium]
MGHFIQKYRILVGGSIWLLWLLVQHPHPLNAGWGHGLLLLAALVVVPLAVELLTHAPPFFMSMILQGLKPYQLPAAMLLSMSFYMGNGWLAMLLAMPWFGVLMAVAVVGLVQLKRSGWGTASLFSLSASMAYLAVAGVWLVLERMGIYPLGFSPDIVFLTIVHFHYAGFVLPLLAGLATRRLGQPIYGQILCYFTVAAVGLLAVGITLTRLGIDADWEMASAWLMALTASGVALMHFKLALLEKISLIIKLLWLCSAMALLGGMLLAGLYGSRFIAPIAWLDIPMMRALHGTLNAVGFGLLGVLGHYLFLDKAFPKH